MRQVPAGELTSYLAWFRTLPMWLDLDGLRIVHACWDENRMARIRGPVTDEFLSAACLSGGTLFGQSSSGAPEGTPETSSNLPSDLPTTSLPSGGHGIRTRNPFRGI